VPDLSRSCFPASCKGPKRLPSRVESEYISQLYHRLDKTHLPNQDQWEVHVIQSQNVIDKFVELQKAETGKFYDLVVEVIRWHDGRGNITLWVSDYSENPAFFNHSIMSGELSEHQEGDPYGYNAKFTKSKINKDPAWAGPYGRRSMQITCYDEQAAAIRENETKPGDWVKLRNVQVKYGSNGANLEGFLRHDESRAGIPKVNVYQLDPYEDPETMDPCLKNAIKRKRDYERSRKKELKEVEEAATAGAKRKAAIAADTSKSRRKKLRAAKNKTGVKTDGDHNDESHEANNDRSRQSSPEADIASIKFNPHGLFPIADSASCVTDHVLVNCEHHKASSSTVSDMVRTTYHKVQLDGEDVAIPLPFANLNYRTHVRVTDFAPADLRDFTFAKKLSEFDALSDNEDSDYASDSDRAISESGSRTWEWRFFLELEDAHDEEKERIWVVVDNESAQCLIGLDALNLRADTTALEALRETLFVLWGNLAEEKMASEKSPAVPKRVQKAINTDRPPPDSSDIEDNDDDNRQKPAMKVANLPFSCCIRQYGIKVRESDPDKADAGDGFRWQRVYGLFGTRVSAP
jgi:protection of telomeres protein 1